MTRPTDSKHLISFYTKVKPHAFGWQKVIKEAGAQGDLVDQHVTGQFTKELLCMFLGIFIVYASLFGIGYLLYGKLFNAVIGFIIVLILAIILSKQWQKVNA